jgi:hypothetical protein
VKKQVPTSGRNYAAWVNNEDDVLIQKAALRLKLHDERGRLIEPKTLPSGEKELSRYAITKSLLLKLANGRARALDVGRRSVENMEQ